MNIFRFAGDMSHVVSILVLLLRLRSSKSACRHLAQDAGALSDRLRDAILRFIHDVYSLYNSFMKVAYIASTTYIIWMIRFQEPYKSKYDASQDSFLHIKFAVAPCAGLALFACLVKGELSPIDILWTFSIFLEALAIACSYFSASAGEVENLTGHYVFFLGAYRGLYILNWVYRSYYEQFYRHNWLVYGLGAVQTALYVDFFYYYVVSAYYGGKLTLPT